MKKQANLSRICKTTAATIGLAAALFAGYAAEVQAASTETATVARSVYFRADDSTSSTVYGTIPAGTRLTVESATTYWVKVSYNGRTGYVSRGYVTLSETAPAPTSPAPTAPAPTSPAPTTPAPTAPATDAATVGARVVKTAEGLQGKVTYVFGARDPSRLIFDCSSFTQYVYKQQGVTLPWSSRQQAQLGKYVSKSSLQVGDLVFFSVSSPGVISHVGIYMGGGKFIHNLPNKGVVISDITSTYWTNHYITARRVIGS